MRPHRPGALHALAVATVLALVLGGPAAASPGAREAGAQVVAQAAPTCPVHSTLGGHQVALHFSEPTSVCAPPADGAAGRDLAIVNEVVRLTDAAPAGSSIRGHVFAVTLPTVGAALERAQRRGVSVRLSGTGALASSTDTVMTYLNAVPHRWCDGSTNDACVSSVPGAVSHAKLFTFSATTDPSGTLRSRVTWISSSNLTFGGGAEDFNNAVTVYGDPALHAGVLGYLDDLYAMSPRTADYHHAASGRGYVQAPSATVYASPQEDADLVVGRLDDVTPGTGCRVRVMQASIRDSRLAVVDQLVRMRAGGCSVRVVANLVHPEALRRLQAAGIPVRQTNVHDKTFIVTGRFGSTRASRVYVGSHNLSYSSNYVHDDVLVRLAAESPAQRPVHDAFVAHFATAYASATPL